MIGIKINNKKVEKRVTKLFELKTGETFRLSGPGRDRALSMVVGRHAAVFTPMIHDRSGAILVVLLEESVGSGEPGTLIFRDRELPVDRVDLVASETEVA